MAIQSSFKNMVVVLSLVCLVSSAVVGGVYALTKEPIDKAQADKENAAIAEVVPQFDNVPKETSLTVKGEDLNYNVYIAKKGNEVVGYAVESSSTGFGGPIKLIVGFKPDCSIYDIAVVSSSETPGLGDKINKNKSDFSVQFKGKNPADFKLAVKKDGGDVDAITASTISSRAFTKAVENAYKILQAVLAGTAQVESVNGATKNAE